MQGCLCGKERNLHVHAIGGRGGGTVLSEVSPIYERAGQTPYSVDGVRSGRALEQTGVGDAECGAYAWMRELSAGRRQYSYIGYVCNGREEKEETLRKTVDIHWIIVYNDT